MRPWVYSSVRTREGVRQRTIGRAAVMGQFLIQRSPRLPLSRLQDLLPKP